MVITEKQNLQTSQADRRHRRMLERMNRILVTPRTFHRPRTEWNSQSQTLRSMDLFGLERDNNTDVGGNCIFQSIIQTVFDNLDDQAHSSDRHHILEDISVPLPYAKKKDDCSSEKGVQVIPITFLDESSNDPITTSESRRSHASSSRPILIEDNDELDTGIEVIDCSDIDTHSSNCIYKCDDSLRTLDDVIDCDTDVAQTTNNDGDVGVLDYDTTEKNRDIDICCDLNGNGVVKRNSASLVRQSLPQLSLSEMSKGHVIRKNSTSDDEIFVGNASANLLREQVRPSQALRTVRSNKDTLVGGANKVLGDMGPESYYEGDNLDVQSGAAYLSGQVLSAQNGHSFSDDEKPVNEVPNYPVYLILKKKLMKECRQIDHIKGDGNCFFRALSKQLYGSERYHIVLRNLIVDIIATNKNKFSQFVDGGDVQDHVERMSQEQSWATTCEIYAAATLLQRDIFMLTPDHLNQIYSWLLFKPVFKMDTTTSNIESHPCYITLCNTNGNHYDRIVAVHGECNCFLPHPELDGISYSVDLTC